MNADFGTYGLILLAFAQVAATFTGFIGVIFVLGDRSRGALDVHESQAVFHLLFSALGALFLTLFTAILLVCMAADLNRAWRIANALGGFLHFYGASRLALETRRNLAGMRSAWPVMSLGMTAAAVSLAAAAGYFAGQGALIFMFSTLWIIGVTATSFVSLLASAARLEDGQRLRTG